MDAQRPKRHLPQASPNPRSRSHHLVRSAFFRAAWTLLTLLLHRVTVFVSFYNPFTKMGGTELVYELFSECHIGDSSNGLCVDDPELVWRLVSSIGFALVVKALLTVATFGIKLPGAFFLSRPISVR